MLSVFFDVFYTKGQVLMEVLSLVPLDVVQPAQF